MIKKANIRPAPSTVCLGAFNRRRASRFAIHAHLYLLAVILALAPTLQATITWSGGTNTVNADQTLQDNQIVITGGTNTVLGAAGPPAGTNAGVLQLNSNGAGFEITGATLALNSDASKPGILSLMGNFTSYASPLTSAIVSGGNSAVAGTISLSSGTRTLTVASGSVPNSGADLSLSATVTNGGLNKLGPGILALSGANTYAGGTTLGAGTLYINSAMALGTQDLTIAGSNTAIDNTSGGPIMLPNNPVHIIGGDLNFTGTNDLNFGTGFSIIANASTRSINVANPNATLTLGGVIGDNGQHVTLAKTGQGTLALGGASLYTGGTAVNGGTLHLLNGAETGAGAATVGPSGTLIADGIVNGNVSVSGVLAGTGTIQGSLTVNSNGAVDLTGGSMTVNGGVTNNGLFILSNGAQLAGVTSFTNNGTLDLSTAGPFSPPNFVNNGTIISPRVKTVSRAGNTVSLTIDSYTGHTYQLQKSTTTPAGANFTTNVGSPQNGSIGSVLTFTDPAATGTASFYRILVNP